MAKTGCTPQAPNDRVGKAEVDSGRRTGIPTEMADRMKVLERENRELRRANEILRKIVGWRVSTSAHAGFALDALEQALHDRRPGTGMGPVRHRDSGGQYLSYLSIRYTERLAEAGTEPSVGRAGDSDDSPLAETIDGSLEAEVIHRREPWRSFEAVEDATLERVDRFGNRRLLEPIGTMPPAEAEANFRAAMETEPMTAKPNLRQTRRGSVLGWPLSKSGKASTTVAALEQALIARFGTLGRVEAPFLLRSENGLVFTSRDYTKMVRSYGLKQEFITPHCPQQNAMMERLLRSRNARKLVMP